MTYIKPQDVTYTDMAIWIDHNVYKSDCDQSLLYEYLYHLVVMLSYKHHYFNSSERYDEFGLYSATRLYFRLYNDKQFMYDEAGNPKMEPVKSILNYIKTVIHPYKVDFEIEFQNIKEGVISTDTTFDVISYISDSSSLFDQVEFSFTLNDVSQIVKSYLKKIPCKKNSAEWINIYISCLLTLLNSITLTRYDIVRLEKLTVNTECLLDELYRIQRQSDPILFHLPKTKAPYIRVLVNELRHVLVSELNWKNSTNQSVDSLLRIIMYPEA